ncbi:MAG TPA: hypothetical protein VGP37_08225 [Candidatus Nanopelagicales bacterium]|nr:hypothetical protein [Candidatus Nanopelagicales bacterium]
MRRALAVLASLGLAAGTITLAIPAHAAANPSTVYVYCNNDVVKFYSDSGHSTEVTEVTGAVGDSFTLTFSTPDGSGKCTGSTYGYRWDSNGYTESAGQSVVLTVPTTPDALIAFIGADRSTDGRLDVTSGGGGGSDSGSSGSSGSAPAPVMQQFGMPASGNCEDGYSDSMDWSGVGSGGWGVSWAQWMNDGSGGVVCSRTVMYDTSTAKWTVN